MQATCQQENTEKSAKTTVLSLTIGDKSKAVALVVRHIVFLSRVLGDTRPFKWDLETAVGQARVGCQGVCAGQAQRRGGLLLLLARRSNAASAHADSSIGPAALSPTR